MSDLVHRFGSAKHPERPVATERPSQLDDATVEALGKLSEALEIVENARGHLYEFHRMSGMADLTLQEAIRALRAADHGPLADEIAEVLVGRDVVRDLWTFQIVESYDEQYWTVFRAVEERARADLAHGERHIFEAEMKRTEQSGEE